MLIIEIALGILLAGFLYRHRIGVGRTLAILTLALLGALFVWIWRDSLLAWLPTLLGLGYGIAAAIRQRKDQQTRRVLP